MIQNVQKGSAPWSPEDAIHKKVERNTGGDCTFFLKLGLPSNTHFYINLSKQSAIPNPSMI